MRNTLFSTIPFLLGRGCFYFERVTRYRGVLLNPRRRLPQESSGRTVLSVHVVLFATRWFSIDRDYFPRVIRAEFFHAWQNTNIHAYYHDLGRLFFLSFFSFLLFCFLVGRSGT